MPISNSIAALKDDAIEWRHHLHAHPELMFDVHDTARFVEDRLRAFGCDEVVTGLGRTGVVGVIKGDRGNGETIGFRSDMDALPIRESVDRPHKSTIDGKMHACGHDGHMAMLLGAARHLCETRDFAGTVVVIFQPAEEGGGGGREMVQDGMMERFSIDRVFGMHNMPGIPVGSFGIRPGPFFAATDEFRVTVKGKGGHAAMPHKTVDPIVVGAQIIQGFQTIASRVTDPLSSIVVSVTMFNAGHAHNVIPHEAVLAGTLRTLCAENRALGEERMRKIARGIAQANDADVDFAFYRGYPVTVNHEEETWIAQQAAGQVVGTSMVTVAEPLMGGEDFAYMLEARPGAMILIGNGDSAGLHHPAYDFDDEAIGWGISYWASLAQANALR